MSGHSKWSTIKRQKGVTDARRGQAFTKTANAITITAREGGGDPSTNFKLRLAIEEAKRINMPKDNIERATVRGMGKGIEAAKFEEVTYEGFGPAGVAVLTAVVTDNKLRTAQEIRSVFDRGGGRLTGSGSVSYLFSPVAQIEVQMEDGADTDRIILAAADAGAEDAEVSDGTGMVYCKISNLEKIKLDLESHNIKVVRSELIMKPINLVKIEDSDIASKVLDLMNRLDQLPDVQKVYANFDIPDEILQKEAV